MNVKRAPAKETLEKIAREIPTPYHLYSEKCLRQHARKLNHAFLWNPGFREYFAVKATPNPYLIKILQEEGCGVDCASLTELMLAEACGFDGEHIMFSSNETPGEEYEYARKLNATINLDDITHIDFLREHGGLPDFISLRYNPGGEIKIGNMVMGNPEDAKFGMTTAQIYQAVERLMSLGVKRFALHSFLVSNALDAVYYPGMATLLFKTAVDLNRRLGARVEMVNLSGGIGVPYSPEETAPDLDEIGRQIRELYDYIVVPSDLHALRISTELGRYMTASCGFLVSTAIHEKHTHKNYIGLDACAVNLMRPAMYGAYHHITVAGKEDAPLDHVYDVVGSLCENNDKFAVDRPLPKIDIGDLVVIHDTGAHGHSMGYNYNGKLRSAEVLLKEDGTFQQIRRAETPADYFATLDFPGLPKA